MQKCVLDQMPQFVQFLVVRSLDGSVVSGRDHRVHALACGLIDDRIAVVAFISDQMLGRDACNQAASLRTIRCGTLCNNDSERNLRGRTPLFALISKTRRLTNLSLYRPALAGWLA